jgi:hypothetical protein
MSYSFSVTASTKDEAKAKAAQEFDAVIAIQPYHAKDAAYALANVGAVIDLMRDDDTQDIRVECWGSLMWSTDPDEITGVTLHAGTSFVTKAA